MTAEQMLLHVPFESVDASSWDYAPAAFGTSKSFRGKIPGVNHADISLRTEVEYYLALERRVTQRWQSTLASLTQSVPA